MTYIRGLMVYHAYLCIKHCDCWWLGTIRFWAICEHNIDPVSVLHIHGNSTSRVKPITRSLEHRELTGILCIVDRGSVGKFNQPGPTSCCQQWFLYISHVYSRGRHQWLIVRAAKLLAGFWGGWETAIAWYSLMISLYLITIFQCTLAKTRSSTKKESSHAINWSWLISPWTKCPPFRRRYFQMHFHEWKVLYFESNFTEVCS